MSGVLAALRRHAAGRPLAAAVVSDGGVLGYASLEARVTALASRLRAGRIRRCALIADNGPDWIVADLAMMAAGITAIPVPLFFTRAQLDHLLSDAGVDAVLSAGADGLPDDGHGFRRRPLAGAGGLALLRRSIRRDTALNGRNDVAKVTYTSGSTGSPRGVCLGRDGMEAVASSLAARLQGAGVRRHLCVVPLATLLENIAGIYVPLLLGAAIHAPSLERVGLTGSSGLDPLRLRRAIDESGAESVILLPQMLAALNRTADLEPWNDCPLRFAAVGGGRVAPAELEQAHAHGLPAYEGYGLSECHSVVTLNTPGDSRPGSAGRPLPHARVRIAPDGEIMVSGAVMQGYLAVPGHGERRIATGEIATGDLGSLDDQGFLHVQGRKKNLFITAFGRNVSPEWVESELVHEPAIAQALVWGEALPCNAAVIVPATSAGADGVQAAIDAANRRLPDYARVSAWLPADAPFRPDSGELTANGRLRRDALIRRYGDRLTDLIHGVTAPDKKVINA
ncbi:AMP-binding protein [Lentisalinibacter sediminis]|uniref:AMP-binding protein n=1 Tax=Lentisalinibacter sediminis TaxID=2992237 RepID=UPI00386FF785